MNQTDEICASIDRATIALWRFAAVNHRAWQRWYEKPTIYPDDVAKRLARKYRAEAQRCERRATMATRRAKRRQETA